MNGLVLRTSLVVGLLVGVNLARGADAEERLRDLEQRYEALDQRYRALESKLEGKSDSGGDKAKAAPSVSLGSSGFIMRSADTNFVFRLRGLLQFDARTYVEDHGLVNDTFLIRRARPIIEGTVFRDFDFLFTPEFGGTGAPNIRDAYVNYTYAPELQLRIGKYKSPLALEQLQSDSTAFFVERAFPSDIAPNRDVGVMIHGDVEGGMLQYQFGGFNGVGDGRNSNNADFDDDKSLVGRVFVHPFRKLQSKALVNLGVGVGASWGESFGATGLPSEHTSAGQQRMFVYRSSVLADGTHWRVSPQMYWYWGPFGFMGEYIESVQRVRASASPSARRQTFYNHAWQVAAGYVLTGEDATYRGVTPKSNFDPRHGGWGAWEIVARYSNLNIDNKAFPFFVDPVLSVTRAAQWGGGVNWWMNRHVRTSVDFLQTDFKGGNGSPVTRSTENVFLSRVQLAF